MSSNLDIHDDLFQRVVDILESARSRVLRSVNSNMVIAYWLIGREIVEEIQSGKERAEYGKQVLDELSAKLANRFETGFSVTNLKNFRLLYQAYPNRLSDIRHPPGDERVERQSPRKIPMSQGPLCRSINT